MERRLAAILAADVAGYSRLMEADDEGTLAALKSLRKELIDPRIAEQHGRIANTAGDGMLVEFSSVVQAVECAVGIQRAMTARNANVSEERQIRFRIGISLGDVISDGPDIHGEGVNVAARLQSVAKPGGVCVNRAVRNRVPNRLPLVFEDLGEQKVKNIERPVHVFRVVLDQARPGGGPIAHAERTTRSWKWQVTAASAVILVVIAVVAVWLPGSNGPPPSIVPPPSRVPVHLLIERGDQLWARRDIVAARQFYEEAAVRGSSEGALKAGMTYDPLFLEPGEPAPDPAKAIEWYEKADQLGGPRAKKHLEDLTEWLEREAGRGDTEAQR